MAKFNEATARHLGRLEQYVPIVDRVHGAHHPEFHDVRRIFETLVRKIKAAGADRPDLGAEFAALRQVTGRYTVPADVCETYEAVYNMLAELDEAYHG